MDDEKNNDLCVIIDGSNSAKISKNSNNKKISLEELKEVIKKYLMSKMSLISDNTDKKIYEDQLLKELEKLKEIKEGDGISWGIESKDGKIIPEIKIGRIYIKTLDMTEQVVI